MKILRDDIKYAIALPTDSFFDPPLKQYAGSIPILRLQIHLILVDDTRNVTIKNPQEFYEYLKEL